MQQYLFLTEIFPFNNQDLINLALFSFIRVLIRFAKVDFFVNKTVNEAMKGSFD